MTVERFSRERRCFGRGERSIWLATDTETGMPVLLTVGPGSAVGLEYSDDGVVDLVASETADGTGSFLVERRPAGSPATALRSDVRELASAVAVIAARAHHRGIGLGGIRPEAVWAGAVGAGDDSTVSLAPRATPFWAAARSDVGMLPGFEIPFLAPELIAGPAGVSPTDGVAGRRPLPADVWALGASIAWWATGAHPFVGDSHDEVLFAIARGERRPWKGDTRLAAISAAAMAPVVERPRMDELVALLVRA